MMGVRVNYLTMAQNFALETACAVLEKSGWTTHLVGSVMERANYRDVDLRCILFDEEYNAVVGGSRVRKRLLEASISEWIAARTGLPIDFQFQSMTGAKEFKGRPRNCVGILIECEAATPPAPQKE